MSPNFYTFSSITYICYSVEEDQALPNPYPLTSIGTNKVQQSLLSGTPVFVAKHANLVVTQAKKADKN